MKTFPVLRGCRKAPFNYPASLSQKLNSQRKEGKHCDVTLIHGNQRFPVHTAVLCAASDYFSSLLDGSFSEGQQKDINVTLSFPNAEALETILHYMYTGELDIHENNIEALLESVHFVMLEPAVKLIAEYLADSLVLENCIEIFTLSSKFDIKELVELSTQIVKTRLHDYFLYHDIEKLYALPPDPISHVPQAFSHLTAEEAISFLGKYLLDLLNGQQEPSKGIFFSCKSMLITFKEYSESTGTESRVSKFCATLIDILSDELIGENSQTVSEKLCSSISVTLESSNVQDLNACASPLHGEDQTDGKPQKSAETGKQKDSNVEGCHEDFEETILIRTEEHSRELDNNDKGKTKCSFYAYLTTAKKWIEIFDPDDLQKYDTGMLYHYVTDMRFIGYSMGYILFTPVQKTSEYSCQIMAVGISPETNGSWVLTDTSHSCLVHNFSSEQFSMCSHHIFVSGNHVFCIYPEVCCKAAVQQNPTHKPELGTFKVEMMNWVKLNHDVPQWTTIGTLELPSSLRTNYFSKSYHNKDGNFSEVTFFTSETPTCTYILACSDIHREDNNGTDTVFAVCKMNHVSCNDDFSFKVVRSGTLEQCWNPGQRLQLAATEQYLMLYEIAYQQNQSLDSWKIELGDICPSNKYSSLIPLSSLEIEIRDEDEDLLIPKVRMYTDGIQRNDSIRTIASTHNGQFYCFENFGPYLNSLSKLTNFKYGSTLVFPGSVGGELITSVHRWYANREIFLPPPPTERVIKEVAIAVVPSGLIQHLRARPRAQFENTRVNALAGPYHHDNYNVVNTYVHDDSKYQDDQKSNLLHC